MNGRNILHILHGLALFVSIAINTTLLVNFAQWISHIQSMSADLSDPTSPSFSLSHLTCVRETASHCTLEFDSIEDVRRVKDHVNALTNGLSASKSVARSRLVLWMSVLSLLMLYTQPLLPYKCTRDTPCRRFLFEDEEEESAVARELEGSKIHAGERYIYRWSYATITVLSLLATFVWMFAAQDVAEIQLPVSQHVFAGTMCVDQPLFPERLWTKCLAGGDDSGVERNSSIDTTCEIELDRNQFNLWSTNMYTLPGRLDNVHGKVAWIVVLYVLSLIAALALPVFLKLWCRGHQTTLNLSRMIVANESEHVQMTSNGTSSGSGRNPHTVNGTAARSSASALSDAQEVEALLQSVTEEVRRKPQQQHQSPMRAGIGTATVTLEAKRPR